MKSRNRVVNELLMIYQLNMNTHDKEIAPPIHRELGHIRFRDTNNARPMFRLLLNKLTACSSVELTSAELLRSGCHAQVRRAEVTYKYR